MTNKIKKTHVVEDDIIALNGQIADRRRAEQRLNEVKKTAGRGDLTPEEDETLEECEARLANRTTAEKCDAMAKSLRWTVSNFLRSRRRRGPELMIKSLRPDQRLVVRIGKQMVTSELFIKAANAFNDGRISGQEFNVIDLHRRNHIGLPDELLNKIDK